MAAIDLADGAVETAKLGDGAVTGGKLRNGAVTGSKVADGSLALADVADVVTGSVFGPGNVANNCLCSGRAPRCGARRG